jgi:phosphosulfolactate synthase
MIQSNPGREPSGPQRRDSGASAGEIVSADFLCLPERPSKPRRRGVTHVIDGGLPIVALESLLDLAAAHIDFVKFGWGTAYVSRHIRAKVVACRAAGVQVCTGGTLLEIAAAQGKVAEFSRWASSLGIDAVEVSEGVVEFPSGVKRRLIKSLAEDFVVLAEVGSKDPRVPVTASAWVSQMLEDLDAGAAFVVAEGRESGTVGLYGSQGEVRASLVKTILADVPAEKIIFEAPTRAQQTWFLRRLGTDVNLGNIAHADVLSVETLRRGLRADTAALALDLSPPSPEEAGS